MPGLFRRRGLCEVELEIRDEWALANDISYWKRSTKHILQTTLVSWVNLIMKFWWSFKLNETKGAIATEIVSLGGALATFSRKRF